MKKIYKNGFTLVELLAVIIILSLLALITATSITNIVKKSREDLHNTQYELIKSTAESWGSDNIDLLPDSGECKYITLKTLKEYGLMEEDITDTKTNQQLPDDLKIKITGSLNSSGKLVFSYEVDPSDIDGCKNINIYVYTDSALNGSDPELYDGLIPVTYDGTNWVVADPSTEWYNYAKQEWANAVILKSGVTKEAGNTVTVDGEDPEALAMFVWIPRYEYKIDTTNGQYGKGSTSKTTPGEIEVRFVTVDDIEPTAEGYMVHSAFTFGNTQLSGLWVGKFETSHTTLSSSTSSNGLNCTNNNCTNADGLRILPNVKSIVYNNVSNFFYAGLSMTRSGNPFGLNRTTTDSHMMKNSEWGAVAYLSQSKYGKYGNEAFDSTKKEVYINNSSEYYTGRSGGSPNASYTSDGTYLYNENIKGTGASTTGNIYGVYDMSGGAWEYVMGYYTPAYTKTPEKALPWGSTSSTDYAKFTSEPAEKYYDAYTTTDKTTACSSGVCYGHALSETSGWYGDLSAFVSGSNPWFSRGGYFSDGSYAGVFHFGLDNGSYSYYSFRVVLSRAS